MSMLNSFLIVTSLSIALVAGAAPVAPTAQRLDDSLTLKRAPNGGIAVISYKVVETSVTTKLAENTALLFSRLSCGSNPNSGVCPSTVKVPQRCATGTSSDTYPHRHRPLPQWPCSTKSDRSR